MSADNINININSASPARYAIGIDLGTTHCALAYVDLQASDGEATSYGVLDVPQLTAPGAVESLPLLPSFLYLPHADELAPGDLTLPWPGEPGFAVGEADTPGIQRQKLAQPCRR